MKSFHVLTAPDARDVDRDTIFVRDGFSWLPFLFPLFWLLFRRLWLIAGVAALLYAISILLAETFGLDALPVAFSFVLGLWGALEGGEARVRKYERMGWKVERVIAAAKLSDAEAIYFADKAAAAGSQPVEPHPALPFGRPLADANAVALGLIGPQIGPRGGR